MLEDLIEDFKNKNIDKLTEELKEYNVEFVDKKNYAVIGSRKFTDYKLLKSTLDKYDDIGCIVSGGANGADSLGKLYADENNIPTIIHKADWKNMSEPRLVKYNQYGAYNALAGHKRNTLIINDCDIVIAFIKGKSSGTKDSISKAKKQNKEVIIIEVD